MDSLALEIKNVLEKANWEFDIKESDECTHIFTGFNGEYEKIFMAIDVFNKQSMYVISCRSLDTKIPTDCIMLALKAVNNFNIESTRVSTCIDTNNGDIIFWLGQTILNKDMTLEIIKYDLGLLVVR